LSIESGAVLTETKEEATERDSSAAMTMEDYLHYESEAFKTPNHGDIVDGIVVRVDADEVLVDIGAKAEGVRSLVCGARSTRSAWSLGTRSRSTSSSRRTRKATSSSAFGAPVPKPPGWWRRRSRPTAR
jgi:exosome complex RNA-binding protein Csl4